MYILSISERFFRDVEKFKKRDAKLYLKISKVLKQMEMDPFVNKLRSHKVNTSIFKIAYSTRVNGDIRILWKFDDREGVILLLALGGHSGGNKVYKYSIS